MMTGEMTDAEVAAQIERADRFIADFREMVMAPEVDPRSPCADDHRRGLARIAETLDAVPFVTMCNLANLDMALHGGLLDLIELRLMCVGAGPTLDYADAAAFLGRVRAADREGAQSDAAMRADVWGQKRLAMRDVAHVENSGGGLRRRVGRLATSKGPGLLIP